MMQEEEEEDEVLTTEERMNNISLRTQPTDQQSGMLCVDGNNYEYTNYDNRIIDQSKVSSTFNQQQTQLLRWYQQLIDIHSPMGDGRRSTPATTDFATMVVTVSLHYEQLQKEYRTLLDLLVTAPSDDEDAATAIGMASSSTTKEAWKVEEDHETLARNTGASTISTESLDPLSAFVQEEDEKVNRERMIRESYQREKKANRSQSHHKQAYHYVPDEPQDPNDPSYIMANASAYIQLILKDLYRLPSPHSSNTKHTLSSTSSVDSGNVHNNTIPLQGRMQQLQSILYIFAISHPNVGYMQGMHEIASYCLYVVEKEMMDVPAVTLPTDRDTPNSISNNSSTNIEALAYWFTEQILMSLYIAYDVPVPLMTNTMPTLSTIGSSRQPPRMVSNTNQLLQMSNRILQGFVLIDPSLYTALQQSSVSASIPYQLIFTKWVRLLFGREITPTTTSTTTGTYIDPDTNSNTNMNHMQQEMSHADIVIYLWDILLDASYRMSQKTQLYQHQNSTQTTGTTILSPIQVVAEYFCAARLWHHKYTILHLQQHSSTTTNNYLLHWLMNVPPESIHQLQNIVVRMNYMIDHQYDNIYSPGSSSYQTNNYKLPPFYPVSAETYAMIQPQSNSSPLPHSNNVPSLQQSTSSRYHPLWDVSTFGSAGSDIDKDSIIGGSQSFLHTAAAAFSGATSSTSVSDPLLAPSLSAFAETISAKTQSIQKLLTKEWEQVRAHLHQDNVQEQPSSIGGDRHSVNHASATTHSQQYNLYNLDYYNNGM